MNRVFTSLQPCSDLSAVRSRLQSVCERFGTVARLDVVAADQAGLRRALCFVRMSSPEEDQRVMSTLGVGRFGGDLVVLMELEPAADASHLPWAVMGRAGADPGVSAARH